MAALLMANGATNGQAVYRLGANAADAGTVAQTGNGRLNLNNALTDTSTDSTKPTIVEGGGPVEDPYAAAKAPDIELRHNKTPGAWSGGTTGFNNRTPSTARVIQSPALYPQKSGNPAPLLKEGETHTIRLKWDATGVTGHHEEVHRIW